MRFVFIWFAILAAFAVPPLAPLFLGIAGLLVFRMVTEVRRGKKAAAWMADEQRIKVAAAYFGGKK